LLSDPVISLPSILSVRKLIGNKRIIVYAGMIVVLSVIAGYVFGVLSTPWFLLMFKQQEKARPFWDDRFNSCVNLVADSNSIMSNIIDILLLTGLLVEALWVIMLVKTSIFLIFFKY
jgi:hypothetical protein